ncbi:Gfo/Idh/MocA family protein [Nocardioides sp. B-3]|uniref:Gfo/Idh/MocA family protein n=1 Tax=Nocardioides sp. B-3 TaxID=2895565 RepID=UPI0021524F5C|nr:Gfo/Idh/MocA family oxidoreductase [Nocardioides sp. B-3]UUZ58626.1 Gfo/Idh/MocA family oxidoreductase [Nocardioides sp. B-3]
MTTGADLAIGVVGARPAEHPRPTRSTARETGHASWPRRTLIPPRGHVSPSGSARTRSCTTTTSALTDPGLDAVIVASPDDDTHEAITVDLLEAGLTVFVEKPLATSTEGCDRIPEVAQRTGSRLYVGHNMRHMPVVRAMRDLIEQGAIGEVRAVWCRHFVGHGGDFYFRDWHAERSRSTGLLLQKGAHDIDVIHWLSGSASRRVTAMGGPVVYGDITDRTARTGQLMPDWFDPKGHWPSTRVTGLNEVIDVEDLSMMLMQLGNGVPASYQQCHFTPDYWRNYTVIGTEGRLENFGDREGRDGQGVVAAIGLCPRRRPHCGPGRRDRHPRWCRRGPDERLSPVRAHGQDDGQLAGGGPRRRCRGLRGDHLAAQRRCPAGRACSRPGSRGPVLRRPADPRPSSTPRTGKVTTKSCCTLPKRSPANLTAGRRPSG